MAWLVALAQTHSIMRHLSPKPVLASPVFQSDWALDKSSDNLVESDPCYGPLGSSVPMHVR